MSELLERATELEFLRWFYGYSDFGPADSEVRDALKECFMDQKKKYLPDGYNMAEDGETLLDRNFESVRVSDQ